MKKLLLFFVVLLSVTFSGCWDSRELNELGLVMAVGVDKSENGKNFLVSVQIARPKGSGNTGGNTSGGGEPVWVGSAEGETLFDAIRNIAKFSSRRIMWAHNNIIIIGERLAREGITPVVDFFTHNSELRMKTWVAVVEGEAQPYISAKTGMEDIPAISISRLYFYSQLPSKSITTDMLSVFRDYKSESIQPIISKLNLLPPSKSGTSSSQVELAGSAIFKGDKLVGWLGPEETRGISWLRGSAKNSIISVSCSGTGEKKVAVELDKIKIKRTSKLDGNKVAFVLSITAEGSITEQDCPRDIDIETFKSEIERSINIKVKNMLRDSVEKVRDDFNSDVVGFGRIVHIQHQKEWYAWIKDKWPELFSKMQVKVEAKIDIYSSETFQIPIKEEKEGKLKSEGKN